VQRNTFVGLSIVLFCSCTFDTSSPLLHNDAGASDASESTRNADASQNNIDASRDAPCDFEDAQYCEGGAPDGPLNLTGKLDTTDDPRCHGFAQSGGPEACLIVSESITVGAARIVGSRPLILASVGILEIQGDIDISSYVGDSERGPGANDDACVNPSSPSRNAGGAGGGAGGSFAAKGGDGGDGNQDESLNRPIGMGATASPSVPLPTVVRGGCRGVRGGHESFIGGRGGDGGASGGAIRFVSTIEVRLLATGSIRATGAAGSGGQQQAGGGGAGSGGYVGLDAPQVTIIGNISANGGGGGEGGARLSGINETGSDGEDGLLANTPAAGGTGLDNAGDGGDGSALSTQPEGLVGDLSNTGAGGGGGGAGFVVITGSQSISGIISPSPIISP
jgi:hypothetical protein